MVDLSDRRWCEGPERRIGAQRATMRNGVNRGNGITVPHLRIRCRRIEERQTKLKDFNLR